MSSFALDGSDASSVAGGAPLALRYPDMILLAVALPVFVLADLPLLGYAVAAVAWVVQHVVFTVARRRATTALREGDRRVALGSIAVATVLRLWIVTAPILAVGLIADREDGLAAAILSVILVTVHLAATAAARLLHPEGATS